MAEIIGSDGQELCAHGTPDFPCGSSTLDSPGGFPWHWHEEWELIFVQQGCVAVAAANQRHTLSAGDAVFINSRVPHAILPQEGAPFREIDIEFHPRLLYGSQDSVFYQRYIRPFQQSPLLACVPLRSHVPWQAQAAAQAQNACLLCSHPADGYPFQVREALSQVFLLLWRNLGQDLRAPSAAQAQAADHVRQMTRYLDDCFCGPVTLADLASHAHLSPRSCQRAFRQYLGLSPMQYVKQKRLQRAAQLLLEESMDITQICYACGFADVSAFCRQFRAYYGLPPRAYRKRHQAADSKGGVPVCRL